MSLLSLFLILIVFPLVLLLLFPLVFILAYLLIFPLVYGRSVGYLSAFIVIVMATMTAFFVSEIYNYMPFTYTLLPLIILLSLVIFLIYGMNRIISRNQTDAANTTNTNKYNSITDLLISSTHTKDKKSGLSVITIFALITVLLLFLVVSPPTHIMINPPSISENLSANETLVKTISIKNLGSELLSVRPEPYLISPKYVKITPIDPKNLSHPENTTPSDLPKDEIHLFRVIINTTGLESGEHKGFIKINATKELPILNDDEKTVALIPVVLNVAKAKGSPTEGATQKESIINVKGNITINEL